MRICKYCNKPIAEKDIMNPDNDGNGYHHRCLVDMEFKARDKQIYDKGKMDVLDKIRAEIDLETRVKVQHYTNTNTVIDAVLDVLEENMTEFESQERNLCDSCKTKGCIYQYGIVRSHCDLYKAESEDKE